VIRVLLADDHPAFLRGLAAMLAESGEVEVVGTAATGRAAVDAVRELRPDAVVMDLHMPELDGVEATARIRREAPETAVLVLTMHDDDASLRAALQAGASGYLLKEATLEEIVAGVRAAAAGRSLIAPGVARPLLERLRHHGADPRPAAGTPPALSGRERDVLALLVEGRGNAEIGDALHLSASTVKTHIAAILEKLGVENRVQAAVLAVRSGLL